jgi:RecA/RadA recombinase
MTISNSLLAKALQKTIKSFEDSGKLSLTQSSKVFPLSTGLLSLDYFLNGGLTPRMYTFAGMEQSGKSLSATTILASAYKQNVPLLIYFDAEETLNSSVCKNVFEVEKFSELVTARKEGKNEIGPRINIVRGNSLEGVMDAITDLINTLPEKVYLDDQEAWYYRFNKDDKKGKEFIDVMQLSIDEKLSKQLSGGKFIFCKDDSSVAQQPGIQAIIVIDSFAILLADSEDEEGSTQQMALEARKFAKHIKRFVGRLEKKQVCLVGINHTREKPGVMYGSPHYEPCGSAIKFYASVQARVQSISPATAKGEESEESIHEEGFTDHYQYKRMKLTKDKVSGNTTGEVKLRVWLKDVFGESRGFDLVYDTLEYLRATKQLEENRGRYTVIHPELKDRTFTYKQLKKLILCTSLKDSRYQDLKDAVLEDLKLPKDFNLREHYFNQLKNREVFANKELQIDNLDTNQEYVDELGIVENEEKIDQY